MSVHETYEVRHDKKGSSNGSVIITDQDQEVENFTDEQMAASRLTVEVEEDAAPPLLLEYINKLARGAILKV